MNRTKRLVRAALSLAVGATLVVAPMSGGQAWAATLQWTGLGATPLWSDAGNWNLLRAPIDGDEPFFAGLAPFAGSVLDVSRSFSALSFTPHAGAFTLRVQGNGPAVLAFSGVGIRNLTAGMGPTRQTFFADGGSVGGTILFTGNSGINIGSDPALRPVDLTAVGGSTAGSVGGHLVFQDRASTGGNTSDALRAQGALVSGASGGEIVFRDSAIATKSSTIVVGGGAAPGTFGGSASFADLATAAGNIVVLAGTSDGLGGRLRFSGTATATSGISNDGAGSAANGAEAVTSFQGDTRLTGSAANYQGNAFGAGGGRLEMLERSSIDSSGLAPGAGTLIVSNSGASVIGASGGTTIFRGDPVTLTLRSSLTWDGGGLIRLVLGADNAGSDHLVVSSLVRGAAGPFVFDLVDFGIVAGASYDLLHFDSLGGFSAGDFTFAGASAAGKFSISDGSIDFTAAAVPEPGSAALMGLGLLCLVWSARRGNRDAKGVRAGKAPAC